MASRVFVALRVRASRERAFAAFTDEIGQWWKPNQLFQPHPRGTGRLLFEPGPDGRLLAELNSGGRFEVGRIRLWEPPSRLVFSWRPSTFAKDQETEVHVSFDQVGEETRVTVEHFGWDTIPPEHVARHHFPDGVFLMRLGEWWQSLLAAHREQTTSSDR